MYSYLSGLTMGLAYVAPIGVQNLFVINSAIKHSRSRALITALIVIFFDVTLAVSCFFGIGAIISYHKILQSIVLLLGSVIVMYIGISLIRTKNADLKSNSEEMSIWKTISSAFVVTWFNPQAIIDGSMMLGAFKATMSGGESTYFILGVVSASFLWFVSITLLVNSFNRMLNQRVLRWINIVCGLTILFYGIKLMRDFINIL